MPVMRTQTVSSERGFTLVELLMVVGLTAVMASIAVMQVSPMRQALQADGAMRVVMGQLNAARNEAMAHRREIVVSFVGVNSIRLQRREVNGTTTDLSTVPFEGGVRFGLMGGVPDTPDRFGNATSPQFSSALTIKFNTDGMLVDAAGSPVNGTVFLSLQNNVQAYRAVTVLGSTGRVRGYRWNGAQWMRV